MVHPHHHHHHHHHSHHNYHQQQHYHHHHHHHHHRHVQMLLTVMRAIKSKKRASQAERAGQQLKTSGVQWPSMLPVSRKVRWLQYHDDRSTGDLSMLLLRIGFRRAGLGVHVALTDHLDKSSKHLRSPRPSGFVHARDWSDDAQQWKVVSRLVWVKFNNADWTLARIAEAGVYLIILAKKDRFLKKSWNQLQVARTGHSRAEQAVSSQGTTMPVVILGDTEREGCRRTSLVMASWIMTT
eukprot:102478-Amphidinium_carterae.1